MVVTWHLRGPHYRTGPQGREPGCSPLSPDAPSSPAPATSVGPVRDSGDVRTWTVEEARAYLPRLRELLVLIDGELEPGPEPGSYVLPHGSEHAEAALAEVYEQGIVLRQVERGLVDFLWQGPDGGMRLLCWHRDEPELAWWHGPDDGFAGRRPIVDVTWPGG